MVKQLQALQLLIVLLLLYRIYNYWLSKNAINAILYGSLVEAYIFMKGEPDVIQQYEKGLRSKSFKRFW